MKIISNAYKDLKKFLPENVEDKWKLYFYQH
jgi:hypothetical protein